jgi:translocation and assembly module TamA
MLYLARARSSWDRTASYMNQTPPPHFRPGKTPSRPWRAALLLTGIALALLQGCGTNKAREATAEGESAPVPASFKVDVVSENRTVADHLETYLDIQRYADFPDLQAGELRRLLGEAESNARDLLAALGYFSPVLALTAGEPAGDKGTRRIVIDVDPGRQTRIQSHQILFAEPMDSDPDAARQRREILRDWLLQDGDKFTEEEWSASKNAALRTLQRERYPTARLGESEARVNADTALADLLAVYNPGPAYRFGTMKLEGVERYDSEGIFNIARIPRGAIYREETLLDAQQRLVSSGLFDSAFLLLDASETNYDEATVIAQLREAKMQKIVFGLGYSTDSGPRFSVDHTHNRMWPLGWRALNQLTAGLKAQSLATSWTAMPGASGWAWNTGLKLERSDYGDVKANSLSLTGGRSRSADKTERSYYLKYDASNAGGGDAPTNSSSLTGNFAWTRRDFNDRVSPTGGLGLAVEIAPGLTVTPEREPFLRLAARALQLWPFGGRNTVGKRSRLAFRVEAGAVYADADIDLPANLLFLTGGDTTVRGYSYQSIGTPLEDGSIYGARYMALAGVEWQHPLTIRGDARSFEHTVFIDTGTATDTPRNADLFTGVGMGLRWSSPVGPLQIDGAYGLEVKKWRLHLRMGFQF